MKRVRAITTLLLFAGMMLAIEQTSFAEAVKDSTSPDYTFSIRRQDPDKPTTINLIGKEFFVESGYASPTPNTTVPGYMQVLQCFDETIMNLAFCVVKTKTAKTYTTHYDPAINAAQVCPVGYFGQTTVTPIQGTENRDYNTFACAAGPVFSGLFSWPMPPDAISTPLPPAVGDTDTKHFYVYAIVSAAAQSTPAGPVLVPNTGFNWTITCFPHEVITPTQLNQYNPKEPPDYACYSRSFGPNGETLDKRPYLLEAGNMNVTSSPATQTIQTTRLCQKNFIPYPIVVFGSPNNNTNSNTTFEALNSFASCIQKVKANASNYNINMLFTTQTTQINKDNNSLTINDQTVNNENGSHTAKSYYNVQWEMYCYPLYFPPPIDYTKNAGSPGGPSGACASGQGPYQ